MGCCVAMPSLIASVNTAALIIAKNRYPRCAARCLQISAAAVDQNVGGVSVVSRKDPAIAVSHAKTVSMQAVAAANDVGASLRRKSASETDSHGHSHEFEAIE